MTPGQPSLTAAIVAIARAVAHGTTDVPWFSDPTAMALLSEVDRVKVQAHRAGPPPGGRARFAHTALQRRAQMMALRTVEIDDALRNVGPALAPRLTPQVVILGAGLDGRAWRMPELANSIVFEVDHPDTQTIKRARIATALAATPTPVGPVSCTGRLHQHAREVRFVPVDFRTSESDVRHAKANGDGGQTDNLDTALATAGHDPTLPTTWIWEGVVMYLTPAQVEATVAIIARRSAPGSRLIVNYHGHALLYFFIGLWLRRLGEPLRSSFSPSAMQSLLARHGFNVIRDRSIAALATELTPVTAAQMRPMRNMHITTASI